MTSGIIDESAIAEALRLGDAQGIERLLRLQGLGLWHGDLADMRRDSPRHPPEPVLPSSSAEDAARRWAKLLRVKAALNRLPQRERKVLELRFFLELPASKIAEELGTTTIYAQELISRSLNHVREIYVRSEDADEL
jgi:RNA polymerase sigma-B factor